eukprot:Ihof_evm5s214 gene=Ihof_evmTU5s214
MEYLSEERKESVETFKAVTQDIDDEKCIRTLTEYNWELEAAILGYMQSGHVRRVSITDEPEEIIQSPPRRVPIVFQRRITWYPLRWGVRVLVAPLRCGFNLALLAVRPVLWLLASSTGMRAIFPSLVGRHQETRQPEPPHIFERRYNGLYGDNHPPFLTCTFDNALRRAKQDLMPLLVYIYKEDDPVHATFARNIMSDLAWIEHVTANFLVWAASETSAEGYNVTHEVLHSENPPIMTVLVQVDSEIHLLESLDGPIDLSQALDTLMTATESANHCLYDIRAQRRQSIQNQLLKEEQDLAFEQALQLDRHKEELKLEEEQRLEAEETKRLEEKMVFEREQEEVLANKQAEFDSLPCEPSEKDQNVVRIVIKLPDGTRLGRRFNESDTVL